MMVRRMAALILAGSCLGACTSSKLTSIAGGESKVFEAPPYEVHGKSRYDQNWIDSQVEGGVAAFGWPRPKPRPVALDAPSQAAKHPAARPPTLAGRLKAKLHRPAPEPVAAPVISAPEPVAPPPSKPRDAADELLGIRQ